MRHGRNLKKYIDEISPGASENNKMLADNYKNNIMFRLDINKLMPILELQHI